MSYSPEEKMAGDAMRQAHAFCPTDLPHLERMRWMGKYVYDQLSATLRQQAARVDVIGTLDPLVRELETMNAPNVLLKQITLLGKFADASRKLISDTMQSKAALSAQPAERQGECLLTLDSGFQIPIVRKGDGYAPDPRFPKVQEKPAAPVGEERQVAEVVTDKQVAAAIKTSPELDVLIDTEPKACIAFAAYRLGRTHAAPVGVPEPRTWITAHSATRSDVVGMLRDEAHEREQADETTGIFADLPGATLLAAIADALESDTLWSVAAAPSAPLSEEAELQKIEAEYDAHIRDMSAPQGEG